MDLKRGFATGWIALLSLAVCFTATGCRNRRDVASEKLIQAFQGACTTTGRWTDAALSHSRSIHSALESLKGSDACAPYGSTLATIQSLSAQVEQLLTDQDYGNYRLAEEKLQELTLALQGSTENPALSEILGTEIVATQVSLAHSRAASNAKSELTDRDRFATSTLMLANTMNQMLQQSEGLAACLRQSPAVALQLATNFMAIGGSFVSPMLGAGVAVVGQLVNLAVREARSFGPAKAISEVYASQMPTALSCGLEAMTELYCDANDAFALLSLQSGSYPEPGAPSQPIWRGLDILSRRLPVLNQWLLKVKNGVRPVDPSEAHRQNEIWKKVHALDESYRNVFAQLSFQQQRHDAAYGNPRIQESILLSTIAQISETLAGTQPFTEKSTDMHLYACWMVLGTEATCPPRDDSEYGEIYIRNKLLSLASMPALFSNWDAIFEEVKTQVDLDFAQTITADPKALLVAAKEPLPDNISPREVIVQLRDFLVEMLSSETDPGSAKVELLRETIELLNDAVFLIDDRSTGEPALDRIRKLFDRFDLRRGLQFFNERVGNLVQWDVQARLRNGEFSGDVEEILKSAGADIRARLTASGVKDLFRVSQDLNRSRSLTESNINGFRKFFESSIAESVKRLHQAAIEAGEPARGPNRPNGQILGQLCTLVLITGEWPEKVSWEICSQAALDSIYPDPHGVMTIEVAALREKIVGLPKQESMCSFHRFLRAGRLAEILRQSPEGFMEPRIESEEKELWFGADLLRFVTGK